MKHKCHFFEMEKFEVNVRCGKIKKESLSTSI